MADLVLRGIEMPQTCVQCKLRYKLLCLPLSQSLRLRSHKPESGRLPGCPIIGQLPEGHGRLIDADALIKEIDDRSMSDSDWWYEDRIDEMPTIVPAEGGNADGN